MSYSVLVKVTTENIPGKKYFLYIGSEDGGLGTLSKDQADTLAKILNGYQSIFSETEVLERSEDEVILLETLEPTDDLNSFDFHDVFDDCPNLLELLEKNFPDVIQGISLEETRRQIDRND